MQRVRTALWAAALLTPLSVLPRQARAGDTAWDAAHCGTLDVSVGHSVGPPGGLHVAPWTVRLTRPDGSAGGRLRATSLATSGPPALDALAPLFAGGLLVGMEAHRPRACDLTHGFRQAAAELSALGPGQSASERWSGVRAVSGGSNADAGAIRLEATHGRDGTARLSAETQELSTAGNDATSEPVRVSRITVSMPYAEASRLAAGGTLSPEDVVTIDRATIETEDGRVMATGSYVPATRRGRLHVVATDFDDLKNALPVGERTEAGAAFLMLRLAGHSDPDGSMSWDITLDDHRMTINGVPLPLL